MTNRKGLGYRIDNPDTLSSIYCPLKINLSISAIVSLGLPGRLEPQEQSYTYTCDKQLTEPLGWPVMQATLIPILKTCLYGETKPLWGLLSPFLAASIRH